ncbi:MAG: PHP domain-containing protein [Actinobacteria bacterium]|nr:PHP domain-containing protein [Actinomycetota bacterium]
MTPVEALERVVHCLDRANEIGFKTKAFVRALDVVRSTPAEQIADRAAHGTLTELDGIGESSATVIMQALAGESAYLDTLEQRTRVPITPDGQRYRDALRGDCHLHSRWSDGGATIEAMARTAHSLGHDYIVLTDHSARLTIAHGLQRDRVLAQLDDVVVLNQRLAPFRILTGIEVDILEDGSLDLDDDMLGQLDVVVASVHSKLRMDHDRMTERMVAAVRSPHVDILGHCTGRLIGKRPESSFDIDRVFAACVDNRTAVELNCRPERLDPPRAMLDRAIALGCHFSISSDAHAIGQLEWQLFGCDRAAERGVPIERIINTWSADDLLAWTHTH